MNSDVTVLPVIMLGLAGFAVFAAGEYGHELEVLVESVQTSTGCPRCGVVATPHGCRDHLVRDISSADRPGWCGASGCGAATNRAAANRPGRRPHPQVARRSTLTERARRWACEQVGRDGLTVEAVRKRLGVGWNTVMRAVRAYGTPLIENGHRLDNITGLGVDEHVWQHAGPGRRTGFATGITDLTPGRPPRVLDVVQAAAPCGWR